MCTYRHEPRINTCLLLQRSQPLTFWLRQYMIYGMKSASAVLVTSAVEGGNVFGSVCLSARWLKNVWTDIGKILWRHGARPKDQVIRLWRWSDDPFPIMPHFSPLTHSQWDCNSLPVLASFTAILSIYKKQFNSLLTVNAINTACLCYDKSIWFGCSKWHSINVFSLTHLF